MDGGQRHLLQVTGTAHIIQKSVALPQVFRNTVLYSLLAQPRTDSPPLQPWHVAAIRHLVLERRSRLLRGVSTAVWAACMKMMWITVFLYSIVGQ